MGFSVQSGQRAFGYGHSGQKHFPLVFFFPIFLATGTAQGIGTGHKALWGYFFATVLAQAAGLGF